MKKLYFLILLFASPSLYAATADFNFTWEYPPGANVAQIESVINCAKNSAPEPEIRTLPGVLSHSFSIEIVGGESIDCTIYGIENGMPGIVSDIQNFTMPVPPPAPINIRGDWTIIFSATIP